MMLRTNNDNHSQKPSNIFTRIKLTPAQQLILMAILSILGSAVMAGFTAAYQQYQLNGVNVGSLINVFLVVFVSIFCSTLYHYVPQHIREELQALRDTVNQYHSIQIQAPAQSPLVVTHAQTPQVATITPVATPTTQPDKDATQSMTNATAAIQTAIQRQQLPS